MNKEIHLYGLLNYLEKIKKEIEADGLIPTIDELIERVKLSLETDETEDDCKVALTTKTSDICDYCYDHHRVDEDCELDFSTSSGAFNGEDNEK